MTTRLVPHATCLGCGCACDDIEIVVDDARIREARRACPLGVAWFGDGQVPGRTLRSGVAATIEDVIETTAGLLRSSQRPLVYLAPDLSCEAQRAAVELADVVRASLDSVTSATIMASVLAAQERGRAGATFGEIRHRADVVVFWGVDPDERYPRYRERVLGPPHGDVPLDRTPERIVIAVDIGEARGPAAANSRISIPPSQEVAVLTWLVAYAEGVVDVPPADALGQEGPEAIAGGLAPLLSGGRYVVIVADQEPPAASHGRDPFRADALLALSQALNASTRGAISLLRGGGNRSGADAVITWQTGYPAAVDFSPGYPQYRPHDAASTSLSPGAIDAVLLFGSAALVPRDLLQSMSRVPAVVVAGPRASESVLAGAAAVVDCGVPGIHEGGTAVRMDDVPLPLRAPLGGRPSLEAFARAVSERIVTRHRNADP